MDEEEDWPKWTAQRGTAFTLDGMPLVEVFKKIQMQIEILKNRPIFDPKRILIQQQPLQSKPTAAPNQVTPVPVASIAAQTSSKTPSYLPVLQPGIGHEIFDEKMAMLEQRLFNLENIDIAIPEPVDTAPLMEKIEELDRKMVDGFTETLQQIQLLETKHTERESEVDKKIQMLEQLIHDVKVHHQEDVHATNKKINDFISEIDTKLSSQMHAITDALTQTQKFLGQFNRLETQLSSTIEEVEKLEHIVSEFVDHKSVSEQRIVSLEFKGGKVGETIETIKSSVKNIQEDTIKATAAIETIKAHKVNREELKTKADLSVAEHKADQSEIARLEELNRELNRRLTMQTKDTSDSILRSQKESDKKIEILTQWCFKQLSAVSATAGDHRGDSGTDIGKIRCLVCDQVVKQATQQDVVFGGPGMTHSIKLRKSSPPRGKDKESNNNRGRSPPPMQRPDSADQSTRHRPPVNPPTEAKSKLTKLMAAADMDDHRDNGDELPLIANHSKIILQDRPAGPMHAPAANTPNQGPGQMTDEENESPRKPTQAIAAPRVVATKQPTIVTSVSNPALHNVGDTREYVTDYVPKKELALSGSDNVMYFKELEGKFAGTGGRRGTDLGFTSQNNKARPGSAPMKRVHSTSKLQSLGKPMNVPVPASNPLLPPAP